MGDAEAASAVLWTADGASGWGAEPALTGQPGTTVAALARSGDRIVAAGNDLVGSRALFWRSDDGVTWSEPVAIRNAGALDVVSQGRRFLAVGGRLVRGAFVPTLWTSRDGRRWVDSRIASTGLAARVVQLPDGPVVVAGVLGVAGAALPVIWRSDDGRRWTAHALPIPDVTADHIILGLAAVPAGAGVLVQWGSGDATRVGVYTSPDGRDWTLALEPDRYISALGVRDGGILALGPGTEWYSTDLTGWAQTDVAAFEDLLPRVYLETGDGRSILAGQVLGADPARLTILEAPPTP
jgi:hypothetical protein